MGYILMVYEGSGYQEFVLPGIDNADYAIILDHRIFGMKEDLELPMEIVDGIWSMMPRKECRIQQITGEDGCGLALRDGLVLHLIDPRGKKFVLVTLVCPMTFPTFRKYSLTGTKRVSIGMDAGNSIIYRFQRYISGSHTLLYCTQDNRWAIQDRSKNGTYLNGRRLKKEQYLNFGDQITLFGLRLIFLGSCLAVCALSGDFEVNESVLPRLRLREGLVLPEQEVGEEAKLFFKRSPRTVEKLNTEKIEIEGPPQRNQSRRRPLLLTIGPSLTMALPMMLGCLMSIQSSRAAGGSSAMMYTGLITAVSSALIGIIWALTNIRYANREQRENEKLRHSAYSIYLQEITDSIRQKYEENRQILFQTYLSGQESCQFDRSNIRLWNHNEQQPDFLAVRLGRGTIPFQAEITIPKERFQLVKDDLADRPRQIRDTYCNLQDVPVTVDLREKGLLGIVGGQGKVGAYPLAWSIAAQIAANNCYTDVKMVFIYEQNEATAQAWSFARWLPHVWTEDHHTRLIAGNKSELGDVCFEMSRVLQIRTDREQGQKKSYPLPHYVIFVDSMELLEGELLERFVYNPQPEYGITAILLTEKYEDLPNTCEYIIQNTVGMSRIFHIYNSDEQSRDLVYDPMRREDLEQLSRRLCGIEVNEVTGSGEIPSSLDFMQMYGVRTLDQLHVLDRWKKNRNYENMRVPIGQKAGGSLCYLDIHEKYHGPHGLVAGTTGSGKSETLQTYILSLAVNFSPDDVAFFIIDFKGGGMANLFEGLPHMAGQISNLSGNQIVRAMISIKSENMRRQRIFAEYDVNNINLYTRLYKNHEAKIPIPHLFIIIDEFAELKREEPEFMRELISVAQVGRSLGVHLILATQKPSGTVDENIWSNSKFRLCLRVQDRQDSNDMLHKPDAAYITQTGRGYLQVGNDEIYEQFQSGYSGAEFEDDPEMTKDISAIRMSLTGKELQNGRVRLKNNRQTKVDTQLDAVVAYLRRIARENHYEQRTMLWLPVLPQSLYLHTLEEARGHYKNGIWPEHPGKWSLRTTVGLYDDPARQAQRPLVLSFSEGGHAAICGMAATGKSTFLQTMLYGLIKNYSPRELNYYILDYSGRMLTAFEKAPHCGGVIVDTDTDKPKKFFHMLSRMLEERKRLFGGANYSQYVQAQRGGKTVPAVLIVIDNYAGFREKTGSAFDDVILRVARESMSYGIFLVLTAAGFGVSEIPSRLGDTIRTIVSLEMSDKFKYAEILHTTHVGILPEKDVKGRGLTYVGDRLLEFQTALALEAEDAYELSGKIRTIAEDMAKNWKGETAPQIPVIPEHPTLADLEAKPEYRTAAQSRRYLPLGYQSIDASVYPVDLWHTYCYLVQGRARSGKKNVLRLLMHAAEQKDQAKVVLIDLADTGLVRQVQGEGVTCLTTEQENFEFFKSTIPDFKARNQRKQELLRQGLEDEALAQEMNGEPQYFIFIADLMSFMKAAYKPAEGLGSISGYLENILDKGSNHGFYFFGAMTPDQHSALLGYGAYKSMSGYGTGIHLGGNVSGQRLFSFAGLPFQEQSKSTKAGLGLVPADEESGQIQRLVLPLVKGGSRT